MSNFINADINAGRFFIRKSKLTRTDGKKMPEYYIEVFDREGLSAGTTGVWLNEGKDGSKYFTGDLSFVARDKDKERFQLKASEAVTKTTKRTKAVSTDPFEVTDTKTTTDQPF